MSAPELNLKSIGLKSIWQPEGTKPTDGYLIIVLHGRGDEAEGYEWLKPSLQIPHLSALLITAPDPYFDGFSWYEMAPHQLPGIIRSRALLEKIFEQVKAYGFPPEKCFLFGFSQGCLMTLEFGFRYPATLAGYIGISGYIYDANTLLKEATPQAKQGKWLVTHGTEDDVLPFDVSQKQVQFLTEHLMPIEFKVYKKAHTIDPALELNDIREWIKARILENKE